MKRYKIIDSTDDHFIGQTFERNLDDPIILDNVEFHYNKIQDLGHGLYRYSNSNYIVLFKEMIDG